MKFKFHNVNQAPTASGLNHNHVKIMIEGSAKGPKGEVLIGHRCATVSELIGQIDIAIEQLQKLRKSKPFNLGR